MWLYPLFPIDPRVKVDRVSQSRFETSAQTGFLSQLGLTKRDPFTYNKLRSISPAPFRGYTAKQLREEINTLYTVCSEDRFEKREFEPAKPYSLAHISHTLDEQGKQSVALDFGNRETANMKIHVGIERVAHQDFAFI